MADLYEYSTPEIVRLLGTRFKDYRMRCGLTQKDVSEQSGIGLTTIHKLESGAAVNLTLSTFILLMKVIGQFSVEHKALSHKELGIFRVAISPTLKTANYLLTN